MGKKLVALKNKMAIKNRPKKDLQMKVSLKA